MPTFEKEREYRDLSLLLTKIDHAHEDGKVVTIGQFNGRPVIKAAAKINLFKRLWHHCQSSGDKIVRDRVMAVVSDIEHQLDVELVLQEQIFKNSAHYTFLSQDDLAVIEALHSGVPRVTMPLSEQAVQQVIMDVSDISYIPVSTAPQTGDRPPRLEDPYARVEHDNGIDFTRVSLESVTDDSLHELRHRHDDERAIAFEPVEIPSPHAVAERLSALHTVLREKMMVNLTVADTEEFLRTYYESVLVVGGDNTRYNTTYQALLKRFKLAGQQQAFRQLDQQLLWETINEMRMNAPERYQHCLHTCQQDPAQLSMIVRMALHIFDVGWQNGRDQREPSETMSAGHIQFLMDVERVDDLMLHVKLASIDGYGANEGTANDASVIASTDKKIDVDALVAKLARDVKRRS